jgi:hypothetical protein
MLGTFARNSYCEPVSGFLRYIGIINAALWFGAGIFFAGGILPAIFSRDMHNLFHEAAFQYYAGGVALILFKRFFMLQYFCGSVAIIHLLAEKLYLGRALPRLGTALVLALLAFGLLGGLWLQPHMEGLRNTKYFGQTQEQKDRASHAFGLWHGLSELTNVLILGGLLVHLIRVSRSAGPTRYGNYYQIP